MLGSTRIFQILRRALVVTPIMRGNSVVEEPAVNWDVASSNLAPAASLGSALV